MGNRDAILRDQENLSSFKVILCYPQHLTDIHLIYITILGTSRAIRSRVLVSVGWTDSSTASRRTQAGTYPAQFPCLRSVRHRIYEV